MSPYAYVRSEQNEKVKVAWSSRMIRPLATWVSLYDSDNTVVALVNMYSNGITFVAYYNYDNVYTVKAAQGWRPNRMLPIIERPCELTVIPQEIIEDIAKNGI